MAITFLAAQGLVTAQAGIVAQGQSGAPGRSDSQIELQNDAGGTYHTLLSIYNRKTIGDILQEAAVSYQANDSTGAVKQMASISAMWANNATVGSGIAVLRFNVDTAGGASDIAMRIWGTQGVTFYGTTETDWPGFKGIMAYRASSKPTICGKTDLVLDANSGGAANVVFLNAFNAGNVSLALGGGKVLVGGALATAGALAGDLVLANAKSLRGDNQAGTNTVPIAGIDTLNIVCLGGSSTAVGGNPVRLPRFAVGSLNAGAANQDGVIAIDTTNTRFVFYVGGARYYVTGTAF